MVTGRATNHLYGEPQTSPPLGQVVTQDIEQLDVTRRRLQADQPAEPVDDGETVTIRPSLQPFDEQAHASGSSQEQGGGRLGTDGAGDRYRSLMLDKGRAISPAKVDAATFPPERTTPTRCPGDGMAPARRAATPAAPLGSTTTFMRS